MDWDGSSRTSLVSRPSEQHHLHQPNNSISFFYNHSHDQYRGMELNHHEELNEPTYGEILAAMNMSKCNNNNYGNQETKKKMKMTSDQLESLERSFQEEIKLDPSRKMKLSKELGLQPRQIAVWFQNRRARWKAKHLEQLYDALKQEFDAMFREKLKLQEEVLRLKAMIRDQASSARIMNQVSIGYTGISGGEETVESRSSIDVGGSSDRQQHGLTMNHLNQIADSCYPFNNSHDYHNAGSPSRYGVFTIFP